MGEAGAIAVVIAEVAVDHLPFEDVAGQGAAVAAAILHDHVADTEIVDVLAEAFASDPQADAVHARALDAEALDKQIAYRALAQDLDHRRAIGDGRDQPRADAGPGGVELGQGSRQRLHRDGIAAALRGKAGEVGRDAGLRDLAQQPKPLRTQG